MTLTAEHIAHLRRPFTPEAVKWRLDQKRPNGGGKARCLVYLDSRLAVERITEVDPNWQADYTFLAGTPQDAIGISQYAPTACSLTLHGVTRSGMGQLGSKTPDGKAAKSVVSDALKRAAVEFGVGAFLYAMPVFMVTARTGCWTKGEGGELGGLTPAGVKELREAYAKVVNHEKFQERFGAPIDYGDVADDERSATPEITESEQTELVPRARVRARGAM